MSDIPFVYYTEREPQTIHHSFGRPVVTATHDLHPKWQGSDLQVHTKSFIRRITKRCDICKTHTPALLRLKLTVGTKHILFRNTVQFDTMFPHNRPALHMVDTVTHFCATSFQNSYSTHDIWVVILSQWILFYSGPPECLSVYEGSGFMSPEMRGNLRDIYARNPDRDPRNYRNSWTLSLPIRATYDKIGKGMDRDYSDK